MAEYVPWYERKISKENYLEAVWDILDDKFNELEHLQIATHQTVPGYLQIQDIMGHFEALKETISGC